MTRAHQGRHAKPPASPADAPRSELIQQQIEVTDISRRAPLGSSASTDSNEDSLFRGRVSSLILFALFMVVILLALVAGVRAYSTLVGESDAVAEGRFSHGLIFNSVISSNTFDAVQVGKGPEGDALVLVEHTLGGSFETRFYKYKGEILQEYTVAGNAYHPDAATRLLASSTFDFTVEDDLLSVSTDRGTTEVALRAGFRGGAMNA